jgi:hypothetical protein
MSRRFRVSAQVDDNRKLISFTMAGNIDTQAMCAHWKAVYQRLEAPWTYRRLFDYRRAEGMVDFDELSRFADWWRTFTAGADYSTKVAVIVNNAFDKARVNTANALFPGDQRQSFAAVDEALDWLDSKDN